MGQTVWDHLGIQFGVEQANLALLGQIGQRALKCLEAGAKSLSVHEQDSILFRLNYFDQLF